jgi:hypothetical protein
MVAARSTPEQGPGFDFDGIHRPAWADFDGCTREARTPRRKDATFP